MRWDMTQTVSFPFFEMWRLRRKWLICMLQLLPKIKTKHPLQLRLKNFKWQLIFGDCSGDNNEDESGGSAIRAEGKKFFSNRKKEELQERLKKAMVEKTPIAAEFNLNLLHSLKLLWQVLIFKKLQLCSDFVLDPTAKTIFFKPTIVGTQLKERLVMKKGMKKL